MGDRRTTIAASADDLDTLQREARRRGISLAQLMREVLGDKAAEIRAGCRPRLGVGRGRGRSAARESVRDEESPASTPPES